MRRAFFVIGPESSGTRMLTKAFVELGAYGSDNHLQGLDTLEFFDKPDFLVFRRSVPHSRIMPPLAGIYRLLKGAGYEVTVILIDRADKYLSLSQVRRGHAANVDIATMNIIRARIFIVAQLSEIGVSPVQVNYSDFVLVPSVRKIFFGQFGLPEPAMEFYNANEAYE